MQKRNILSKCEEKINTFFEHVPTEEYLKLIVRNKVDTLPPRNEHKTCLNIFLLMSVYGKEIMNLYFQGGKKEKKRCAWESWKMDTVIIL